MSSELLSVLAEVLNGSLNPDATTRITAELKLGELMKNGETGLALATLLVTPDFDLSLRQMSTVLQRKYLHEHWSPFFPNFKGPAPSVEIKASIRDSVYKGLSDPVRKIRSLCGLVLSTIASSDWPDECPDLLTSLITLLSGGQPDPVDGAMRVFAEFIKSDLGEDQILPILKELLPVLMNILGSPDNHSALTRSRVLSVFNQAVQVLFMVKEQHPQAVKDAVETILPTWLSALKVLLEIDPRQDVASEEAWDGLVLRVQIFKVLERIQYLFPKALPPPSSAEFLSLSVRHLESLLPTFQTYYISSTSSPPGTSEDPGDNKLLSRLGWSILEYIRTASKSASAKPWFNADGTLVNLIGMIFAWTQMTEDDEDKWSSDANAFVADEDDEDAWTIRAAAFDVVSGIIDRFEIAAVRALDAVTKQVIQQSAQSRSAGQENWWRLLEATLATLGAVSEAVLDAIDDEESDGNKAMDIQALLIDVIPSLLTLNDLPFVQGRGFVFTSQYAGILPQHLVDQYISAAAEALEAAAAGLVVKVSAIKAIRNFYNSSSEKNPSLNTRILSGLAPLLQAASEDTLTLVMEALLAVIETDDCKWLTPEIAAQLVTELMQVWVKNLKDPLLLSVLTDCFVALAKCPTPGVYQAVVTQSLPALSNAIAQAKPDEGWVASSAFDLATSLMRGAQKGNLGDGFFSVLGPALFDCLLTTEDRETIQNGIECLTFVIRKGCDQLMVFTSPSGEKGLNLVLKVVAKLLAPVTSESEAGGLFVGDMIVHLLRNAGEANELRVVLPELLTALAQRMETAKTSTFIQSLIIPFAYLIHSQREIVLDLLESVQIGSRNGLEVVLNTWCENAETFQGYWANRISTLALCQMLLSERPSLKGVTVKGDLIIRPETKNVIMTRSRTKQMPLEYTSILFHVRALKLLIHELQAAGDDALAVSQGRQEAKKGKDPAVDVDLEAEDDEEAQDWEDEEDLYQGIKDEELGFLSQFIGDDNAEDKAPHQGDDEDLKDDPISQIDMRVHLLGFFRQAAQSNVNNFSALADQLTTEEIVILRRAIQG
ncbi:hypothetical protein FRC03_007367 [Tulasnella sp. 419]|nr:hypothetical protein FRC03_007367 [Tulasnella sp. 419]